MKAPRLPAGPAHTQHIWRMALMLAWNRIAMNRPEQLRLFDEERKREVSMVRSRKAGGG